MINDYSCTVMFWGGWDDEKTNGQFVNANTGETLVKEEGYWPFFPGEPNGGTMESCVVVWPARNAWNDFVCSIGVYGFCHMEPRPRFVLRGWVYSLIVKKSLLNSILID